MQVGPRTRNTHRPYAAIRYHVQQPDLDQAALLGWIVQSWSARARRGHSRSLRLVEHLQHMAHHGGVLQRQILRLGLRSTIRYHC